MAKNILVVGAAHNHVLSMAQSVAHAPDCQLVGVWDDQPQVAAAASEKLNVPAIPTLDEVWKLRPALVLIGAVPTHRASLARQAVAHDSAALVDKPLALSHEELDLCRDAVKQHGKPIITYYPYRGSPDVLAARKAFDAGAIGKLVRVFTTGPHKLSPGKRPDWHWTRAGNGGCIVDVGSHGADLCCWIAGAAPEYVSCIHGNLNNPTHREFQDFAQAQLRFPGGVMGHVEADWFTNEAMKSFGDGRMWIQGTTGKIELYHGDPATALMWTATANAQPLDCGGYPDMDGWTATLIADLASGRPGDIAQEDVWRASRVTLYALQSAEAGGQPVHVKS